VLLVLLWLVNLSAGIVVVVVVVVVVFFYFFACLFPTKVRVLANGYSTLLE
jgi:hypothetical protein